MIVYRGPTDAFGGGTRNWGGTVASQPNIAKNSLVCWASVPSLPGCPGSPVPETRTAWASPGPVMRAWEGPFASAGVASAMVAAMLMPAARAAATVSLRSIGRLLRSVGGSLLVHRRPVPGSREAGAVSARRAGDGERGCLAEVAF